MRFFSFFPALPSELQITLLGQPRYSRHSSRLGNATVTIDTVAIIDTTTITDATSAPAPNANGFGHPSTKGTSHKYQGGFGDS
jgi:hypothetical protein